ncbi:MAG: hypothetical protein IJ094_06120 [Bacilli bacterium]|nr:hypothetical protein [Bacilli bacterium]
MTKDEFINLDTKDMLNYINTELSNGKQFDQVRKEIGFGDKVWKVIREARGIIYNQKTKQYISTTESTTVTTTKPTTKELEGVVVENNTNTLLTTEKANTLDYINNNINILMDIIDKYKATTQTTTESTTNYITIDLIDDKHLKPKPKSIRINEFIYQEWQEFCDKQHYSKMDLISMALKEYMEKYK